MIREQIEVLEEWYRWGEEWNIVLRVFGRTWKRSRVLEIGCGLGRIAFPLRFTLLEGAYEGFDICEYKIQFLQERFQKAFPNFRFSFANVKNTAYNPSGSSDSSEFTFPYEDSSFDTVYAASVFTHLLPAGCRQYFRETARVLRPDGRAVFSFFLLDFYVPGRPRPLGFAKHYFDFTHRIPGDWSDQFAIANPENPEETIAYNLRLIREFADEAGLVLDGEPLPGLWSGADGPSIGAQDLLILRRA
jgi:SAM-dependent methyltransferase